MSFRKISDQRSKHDHYSVDACVISCIDQRFADAQREFQKEQGWNSVDPITAAGGAKGLTGEYTDLITQHYLWQIGASINLHKAPLVVLEVHENCGAYAGAIKEGDEAGSVIESELNKARANVLKYLEENKCSNVDVRLVAVCHDSIKELE